MKKLKSLEDLFHHHLKDVYSAEQQLIKALPEMNKKASSPKLKEAISEHLKETKEQKNKLDKIGKMLGIDLSGETCEGMQGLIEEAKDFISEDAEDHVRDAGIIADAQRVEHYEISAYGTLVHYAKILDHNDAAEILQEILNEESTADKKLNKIAVENINKRAVAS